MACAGCRVPVSKFITPFGEEGWEHSQSWKDFDHDPKPVPANYGDMILECDFCGNARPRWQYRGAPIHLLAGERDTIKSGGHFSGCDNCDTLVKRQDFEALADRALDSPTYKLAVSAAYRKSGLEWSGEDTAEHLQIVRKKLIETHKLYIKSITSRSLIPPPPPPTPKISPSRIPRVRDRLAEFWQLRGTELITESDEFLSFPGKDAGSEEFSVVRQSNPTIAKNLAKRMAFSTEAAELYWISPQFTKFAVAMGKKLPDITITRSELPAPHGLMVFGTPVHEFMWDGEVKADVVAVSWALVPGGVWMVQHIQPEQTLLPLATYMGKTIDPRASDLTVEDMRRLIGFLLPLGPGSGIPFGTEERPETGNDTYNVWSALIATWALMEDSRIATETQEEPEKSYARPYTRKHKKPPAGVRCVNMRKTTKRPATQPSTEEATSEDNTRVVNFRSMVGWQTGGFLQYFWYGPGKTLRKRRWVKPFPRGPKDKPFAHEVRAQQEVVRVLR
jgi:hypothetical protein